MAPTGIVLPHVFALRRRAAARGCSGPNSPPLTISGPICLMINGEVAMKVHRESQANTSFDGCGPLPAHSTYHACGRPVVRAAGPTNVSRG